MVSLWGLELGSHVTSAVNGSKGEVSFVCLEVASNLTVPEVESPCLSGVPSKSRDPVLGPEGGDGAISVTGVVEHAVLASKSFVNPLGALGVDLVVNLVCAEFPLAKRGWDVKSITGLSSVQVFIERTTPSAWGEHVTSRAGQPRGIIVGAVALSWRAVVHLGVRLGSIADAKNVVDVNVGRVALELSEESKALWGG